MYDKHAYVCLSEKILETTWMPSEECLHTDGLPIL